MSGPVGDPLQSGDLRDLLDLFREDPLHELLTEVVTLVAGDAGKPADLLGRGVFLG